MEIKNKRAKRMPRMQEQKMEQTQIIFQKYNYLQTPKDVLEYADKYNGICGEASIASLLDITVKDVFDKGDINRDTFRGFTLQKEMRKILSKLGCASIQKRVSDKHKIPYCDFGIIRVSFGEPEQHWAKTASLSHYIAIKRFKQGRYIYDTAIDVFDGNPVNGVWIEESEYYKIMDDQKMFITSYLELTKMTGKTFFLRRI